MSIHARARVFGKRSVCRYMRGGEKKMLETGRL